MNKYLAAALSISLLAVPAIAQVNQNKLNVNELRLPSESVSKALYLNGSGQVKSSALVDATELSNLDGSTSNIQTQLNDIGVDLFETTSNTNANTADVFVLQGEMDTAQADIDTAQADIDALESSTAGLSANKVTGPASSTDNAVTRYDGTTGKLIQNSSATLDDSGNMAATSFSAPSTSATSSFSGISILNSQISSSGTDNLSLRAGATGTTTIVAQGDLNPSRGMVYTITADATTTGTNATVTAFVTKAVRFTNASLVSVAMIAAPAGTGAREITFFNNTGNQIAFNYETGATAANRITGPSGSNAKLKTGMSIDLVYNATSSRWVVKSTSGGGGSGSAGIELMTDPSFEDATNTDSTASSNVTLTLQTSAPLMVGPFNEKMLQLDFGGVGYYSVNKTTGSSRFTGARGIVGGFFYSNRSDDYVEPLLNGITDGRTCAIQMLAWTYCVFEVDASLPAIGWNIVSTSATPHFVYADITTVSVNQKFSANAILPLTDAAVFNGYNGGAGGKALFMNTIQAPTGSVLKLVTSGGFTQLVATQPCIITAQGSFEHTTGPAYQMGLNVYNSANTQLFYTPSQLVNANTNINNAALTYRLNVGDYIAATPGGIATSNSGNTTFTVSAVASSPSVITSNDIFSTDISGLFFKSTACLPTELGCFNTYFYNASANAPQLCTTAPTQLVSSMNANGLLLYTRSYNAASTCANPVAFGVTVGTKMKGWSVALYKSTGKSVAGEIGFYQIGTTGQEGINQKTYDEVNGILYVDAGRNVATTTTSATYRFKDDTGASSGYVVLNASKNASLAGLNLEDFLPAGFLMSHTGASCPAGYLLGNGASYLRTEYPKLYNNTLCANGCADSTHFNVVDARGRFGRYLDGGVLRDEDRLSRTAMATGGNTADAVGSIQTDAFKSHAHTFDLGSSSVTGGTTVAQTSNNAVIASPATGSAGGSETRPENFNVLPCVKY